VPGTAGMAPRGETGCQAKPAASSEAGWQPTARGFRRPRAKVTLSVFDEKLKVSPTSPWFGFFARLHPAAAVGAFVGSSKHARIPSAITRCSQRQEGHLRRAQTARQ
jgi:hypothetical protein